MIRDVLVFTPVYRLEPETAAAVLNLEWDGAISVLFQRDNPDRDGRVNHLHQYQRGREAFLAGRYEALLVVESDVIPPPDALQKMAALMEEQAADVVYGVYRFRVTNVVNVFELYPGKPRNVGESLSLHPRKLRAAVERGWTPCSGAGLGIVLIRREVLERIEFRRERGNMAHCDTYFSRDVLREGFRQVAEMSVVCGHKHTDGVVLWPDLPDEGRAIDDGAIRELPLQAEEVGG